MASASQEETWPVATVDGVPMDFFQTIGLVMVDEQFGMIEDLMLVEFLERRLAAGKN
jgi:hypothetical protein